MSYSTLYALAKDPDFIERVTACAALEGITQADKWADDNRWLMAAQPGFDDAYAYAVAFNNPAPGKDAAVITDGQILSAVQLLLRGNP